ncbi:MAG: hydrolase [bacterium]
MDNTKEDICCPRFNPEPWDDKEIVWENKTFITATMPQFLHMPLPGVFGKTVTGMMKRIEDANAKPSDNEFFMLSFDPSPWKSELYITTTNEIESANNIRLSGTFLSKAFDGPFSRIPQFMKEMEVFMAKKNKKALKYYFYYTTCPKCAKKYGHNYIVILGQIK